MTGNLSLRIMATALLATMVFSAASYVVQPQEKPNVRSQTPVSHKPAVEVFVSVLPQIKAKSHVPVLLPSELPSPIAIAKYAVIDGPEASKYAVTLFYKRQSETAYFGFAAFFSAEAKPSFSPQELPDVENVNLTHHLHGFFRAASCSGSCAPANLWWEQNGVVYLIQLMLNADLSDQTQENATVAVANSAIVGGPR